MQSSAQNPSAAKNSSPNEYPAIALSHRELMWEGMKNNILMNKNNSQFSEDHFTNHRLFQGIGKLYHPNSEHVRVGPLTSMEEREKLRPARSFSRNLTVKKKASSTEEGEASAEPQQGSSPRHQAAADPQAPRPSGSPVPANPGSPGSQRAPRTKLDLLRPANRRLSFYR